MELAEYLDDESILSSLSSADKEGVLKELVEALINKGKINDSEAALSALLEREALGSTGVGEQVAIPHAKIKDIDDIVISIGVSSEGVDFGSSDGKPVKLFFLLIAPEKQMNLHLKTLARISRLVKMTDFKDKVFSGGLTSSEIFNILKEAEAGL
jgi:PTS system nitrogen regulatory IIA component